METGALISEEKTSLVKKLRKAIQNFGPGFFIMGYVIGTGSVTSMVVSGATFGLTLSWALLLSCFFTYFLLISISKLTLISGETLMYNFKQYFGKPVTIFILSALTLSIVSSCIGVMGVLAEVVTEWFRVNTSMDFITNPLIAIFFVLLLLSLFWTGRHKTFVDMMTLFVAIMALAFVITSIMVLRESNASIVEFFPAPIGDNTGLVIAGMVGTTMAGVCLVSRSILVQEQGWTMEDLKKENRDAKASMTLTFLVSVAIMISATGTLYFQDIQVDNATDMMNALGPWAGEFALTLFTLGIVGAGLSSIFPNLLLFPWLVADYTRTERNMKKPRYKLFVVIVALFCLVVPLFGGKPVWILIASQALSPFVMPLITLFLLILLNRKKIMKQYKVKTGMNLALMATLIFNCYMLYIALKGFIEFIYNTVQV